MRHGLLEMVFFALKVKYFGQVSSNDAIRIPPIEFESHFIRHKTHHKSLA